MGRHKNISKDLRTWYIIMIERLGGGFREVSDYFDLDHISVDEYIGIFHRRRGNYRDSTPYVCHHGRS